MFMLNAAKHMEAVKTEKNVLPELQAAVQTRTVESAAAVAKQVFLFAEQLNGWILLKFRIVWTKKHR
jgi:hypothetical protein